MAYDEILAERVRASLDGEEAVERKMFGGLAFMVGGHMAVGVLGDKLVIRLSAERADEALELDAVREMDFTGRPMKGFLYVSPEGTASDDDLEAWVAETVAFARSKPPKA